jgi:hypothetical protein
MNNDDLKITTPPEPDEPHGVDPNAEYEAYDKPVKPKWTTPGNFMPGINFDPMEFNKWIKSTRVYRFIDGEWRLVGEYPTNDDSPRDSLPGTLIERTDDGGETWKKAEG